MVFPLVTATTMMVATAIWVPAVPFGRLLSTIVAMPGAGDWVTVVRMWAGTTAISDSALVFVAWGISFVDYLTIYPEQGEGLTLSALRKLGAFFIP